MRLPESSKWNSDYSNLILGELKKKWVIQDPGGNAFVDISLPDCTGFVIAQNSSSNVVGNIYIIGTTFYHDIKILRCHLNASRTGQMYISVIYG